MGIADLKYVLFPQYHPYDSEKPKALKFRHLFDAKDNEDVFSKSLIVTKKTATVSAFMTMADIIGIARCETLAHSLSRVIFWMPSAIGAGIAYVVTTGAVSSLRNKPNDSLNHMIGGFAFGAIYGLKHRNIMVGLPIGFFMGLLGYVHKEYAKTGFKWYDFDDPVLSRNIQGHAFSKWTDFSSERSKTGYPRTWVRELPNDSNSSCSSN